MGASGEGAGCLSGTANMVSNLPSLISGCSGLACLSGAYWSSTEYSVSPQYAWFEYFNSGGSTQTSVLKNDNIAVRCSRASTP
jgi:ABC-type xylose transport system permease subunit